MAGFADGPGDTAQFNEPVGIVVAPDRTLFVTDSKNHRIRAISVDGEVRTHSGLGVAGFTDGVGIAARFNLPWGLALDERGTLYLADRGNHRIRTVAPDGRAGTLAGTGAPGFNDGSGEVAQFDGPRGLALSPTGLLYLTDTGSNRVRRLTPDGTVSTLAGAQGDGYLDGVGTAARFSSPRGLAIDAAGQIYVADFGNHRIRQITPDGTVATFAGSGVQGSADGLEDAAEFDNPLSLAVAGDREVLVGEFTNSTIRRIASTTVVVQAATELNGDSDLDLGWPLTGLQAGVTYYFRAFATNGGGTTFGDILSFCVVMGAPPLESWQMAQFGPQASEPLIAGLDANPSGDGVPNLQKYAFLMDPQVNCRDGLPVTAIEGDLLTVTYTKVLAATDLTYTVEHTNDMVTWDSTGVTEVVLSDDGTTQQIRASVPIGTGERKFLRVSLTTQ